MILCALDVATTTGLAITDGDRVLHWESHRPAGDTSAQIHSGFRRWLFATLAAWTPPNSCPGIERVVIEQPIPSSRVDTNYLTIRRLHGLVEAAGAVCFDKSLPFDEANIRAWRSGAFGKKVSPPKNSKNNSAWWKERAMERCHLLGIKVTSKDAAEAICIAHWYAGHLRLGMVERPGDLLHFHRDAA